MESQSRFITWSETTEQIFGFARGTFRGGLAQYLELIHPDHRDLVEKRLRQVAREGGSVDWEARIVRRDGASRWVSSRGDVIRNEEGRILRVVGAVLDITEQHLAAEEKAAIERRLQESQKLESLGILAGGIAHDFNNLLTGILGNTSLMRLDLPEDSPVLPCVQAIEHTSRRAADLCKQMLAYSGKGRLLVQHLDLNEITRETAQLIHPSISKDATLEFDLAPDLPAISADGTQMRQIIMNVVINASDALGENPGVIRLTTGLLEGDAAMLSDAVLSPEVIGGDFVFLAISDTGCGMTPDVREKIFDPFFTTKFTGRGLGLAAVLGIVRGHGGALKVTSTLGQGSTFQLLLPCAAGVADALRPGTAPVFSTWRGTGTVLVVDDEETVRGVASRSLVALALRWSWRRTGREAIASFREDPAKFLRGVARPHHAGDGWRRNLRRTAAAQSGGEGCFDERLHRAGCSWTLPQQ
jgi:PAS domain S-box-containing protein